MQPFSLSGVLAPMPTPFSATEEIDLRLLRDLVVNLAGHSLAGVVVLGTSGEAPFLSEDEADQVVEQARPQAPQFPRSVVTSTQLPPQSAPPVGQRQRLPWQVMPMPTGQMEPQAPQL